MPVSGLKAQLQELKQEIADLKSMISQVMRAAKKPLSEYAIVCFRCQDHMYITLDHVQQLGKDAQIGCPACGKTLYQKEGTRQQALEVHRISSATTL